MNLQVSITSNNFAIIKKTYIMNHSKTVSILSALALGLSACSSGDKPTMPETPSKPEKLQIKINANPGNTRVTDNKFDNGDRVGIFVVNYDSETPGSLSLSGNHVDNMAFSYSGSWTSATPIYWKDDKTHADFYLYYPYSESLPSVYAIPFEVKADQSSEQNYKASEFMTGKTINATPSESAVNITANHLMSQANIYLEPASGFTTESLASANVAVRINGALTHISANLATGEISVSGDAASIVPLKADNMYKALIPPQTIAEGNLITVTVDGRDFNLRKAFKFESGKIHKFTVALSKTSNGVNVDIAPWENDGTDNGGTAE